MRILFAMPLCLLIPLAGFVSAQEVEESIEATVGPEGLGVIQLRTADGEGATTSYSFTTGDMGAAPFIATDAMWSRPTDSMSMLGNTAYQQELGLADEQIDQIRDLSREYAKKMQEQFSGLEDGKLTLNPTEIKDVISKLNEEKQSRISDILLPAQVERLNQIKLQNQMRSRGDEQTLTSKKLMEELGIDEEQAKKIKERSKELKKQLEEDIQKLKEQAREDLFDELTSDQRKKINEMLGEKFDYKPMTFRERIRKMREHREEKE